MSTLTLVAVIVVFVVVMFILFEVERIRMTLSHLEIDKPDEH